MRHYYNEFDERNVYMLRQLMSDGLIPEGDIDGRSITEVTADDLRGYCAAIVIPCLAWLKTTNLFS